MFLNNILICVLFLTTAYVLMIRSEELIGCTTINKFQEIINQEPLDLRYMGDIAKYYDIGIVAIISKTNNNFDKLYIDAKLEEFEGTTNLIIFTTEHFEKYAKEQTSNEIVLNIVFTCSGQVSKPVLLFSQPLKEDNYFAPELSKDVYSFSVPTPIYKGFELTMFEEISARDDDIWDNDIRFSSPDSQEFNILTATQSHNLNRTYFASLKLMSIVLSMKKNIEFSLIATDSGKPPRSSLPAKVIITSDDSNSFPAIPKFIKTLFRGSIDDNLKLSKIEVMVDPETYTDEIIFSKLMDDQDLFYIESTDNIVSVKLNKKIDLDFLKENKVLTFDIEASNRNIAESGRTAVLIIYSPNKDFHFEKEVYRATLNIKVNNVTITDLEIKLDQSNTENVGFDLNGEYAYMFDIIITQNIINLKLKSVLATQNWTNICYFTLKLQARTDEKLIANTNIIIDVIRVTWFFERPVYTGELNSNGSLEIEPIILKANEIEIENINIELKDPEQAFTFTREGNKVLLQLTELGDLRKTSDRAFIRLEVIASEETTGQRVNCLVLILAQTNDFRFSKNLYEGQIDFEAHLDVEDIFLDKSSSSSNDVEFKLLGEYASYFRFRQTDNVIKLSLASDLNIREININATTIWLELNALNSNTNCSISTIIIVTFLQDVAPEFEKFRYSGELTDDNILNLDKLTIKLPTWRTYTRIELQGDHSDFFEISSSENIIEIFPISELPKDSIAISSILLEVIAYNHDRWGYATVLIHLQKKQHILNIFTKSIQKGKISQTMSGLEVLDMHDIELEKENDVVNFKCNLTGDEADSFEYTVVVPKNVIKVVQVVNLPNEIATLQFYTTLLLECRHREDATIFGSTMIFLELPGTSVGCPTPAPPTFIPEFRHDLYNFFAKPNFVGSLKTVNAIIKGSASGIRYYLRVNNEHLKSRIDVDQITGEIFITGIISPGRYYFDIVAENIDTQGEGIARGILDVEALIQCADHVSVSNSFIIKYLDEEVEHNDILKATFETCEFYIFSMEPNNKVYFSINPVTKMLAMISVDREDMAFSNMVAPQIEVKLKLNCSGGMWALQSRSSEVSEIQKPLLSPHDIIFTNDATLLSVVLVDINDNYPEFVYPKYERLVVGYPESKISVQVLSEYIVQVTAQDADDGLNAVIRYSMQLNDHFQINPNNGKIYPYANAMKGISELNLTVYATDRNGADEGLTSKITLTIKVLTSQHFVLLTFLKKNVNSIETLMEEISNKTGLEFIPVKFATVSILNNAVNKDSKFKSGTNIQFVQKVWSYAFDGSTPVYSINVKGILSKFGSGTNISAQTFEEAISASQEVTEVQKHNVTGYIIGLCLLAVILLASTGFIYWKYAHQRLANSQSRAFRNSTPGASLNQNFNIKQTSEVDMQRQAEMINKTACQQSFYSKRESVKILGTTTQESTDDGMRRQIAELNSTLQETTEEDETESNSSKSSLPPRATVTFNELVEKIHIRNNHLL